MLGFAIERYSRIGVSPAAIAISIKWILVWNVTPSPPGLQLGVEGKCCPLISGASRYCDLPIPSSSAQIWVETDVLGVLVAKQKK
jgi:hypothetical protein